MEGGAGSGFTGGQTIVWISMGKRQTGHKRGEGGRHEERVVEEVIKTGETQNIRRETLSSTGGDFAEVRLSQDRREIP